jgi:hypothetical protein
MEEQICLKTAVELRALVASRALTYPRAKAT